MAKVWFSLMDHSDSKSISIYNLQTIVNEETIQLKHLAENNQLKQQDESLDEQIKQIYHQINTKKDDYLDIKEIHKALLLIGLNPSH